MCIGSKEYILNLEVQAISAYKTQEKFFGYNIKPGGESGRGYSVGGTKRDVPVFVSGFWFPNRRTVLKKLNMTISVYKNRKKRKTLGFVQQDYEVKDDGGVTKFSRQKSYYQGFWFPSLYFAAKILNKTYSSVYIRYSKGDIEEYVPERRGGNQNIGRKLDPKDHPSSISVVVEGVKYDSLRQATEATGYSKYIINQRIKQKYPDFKYAQDNL